MEQSGGGSELHHSLHVSDEVKNASRYAFVTRSLDHVLAVLLSLTNVGNQ